MAHDVHDYYSSADQFHCASGHAVEPTPYLDPAKTISQLVEDDYEVPPRDQPHLSALFDDTKYAVTGYMLPTNNGAECNAMESSALPAAIPEDEQIYEDPGYVKEGIYEKLKQKNIGKIDVNNIR